MNYGGLVLAGGGVNGLAMLGALYELNLHGALDDVHTIVGASIGSCLGAAVAARRDLRELLKTFMARDSKEFLHIDFNAFLGGYAVDTGAGLEEFVRLFVDDEHVTFRDLHVRTGRKLVVCVTCLTDETQERLSVDTCPDMSVALALKMSCSIPLLFPYTVYKSKQYVDGGITNNFPVDYFADQSHTNVLGIRIATQGSTSAATSFDAYVTQLLRAGLTHHEVLQERAHRRCHVLRIPTPYLATQLLLDTRQTFDMFVTGQRAAQGFVKKMV